MQILGDLLLGLVPVRRRADQLKTRDRIALCVFGVSLVSAFAYGFYLTSD